MDSTDQEDEKKLIKSKESVAKLKRVVVLAIGGGGSRVVVDLINKSRKLLEVTDSIYFLDTMADSERKSMTPDRISDSVGPQLLFVDKHSERELVADGRIPVTFIEYGGGRGTGRDFVRSEICANEYLIPKELKGGRIPDGESRISEEDRANITRMWEDLRYHNIILFAHSLGGGTGGGSAPVIARKIKEWMQDPDLRKFIQNTTLISLCFLASKEESPALNANSVRNLMEISKYVDIVLLFSNTQLEHYTDMTRHLFTNQAEGLEDVKNLQICRVFDILLSSKHDFNDFRNIITDSATTNIVVPYLSMKNERIPPLSEIDALNFPMAPVCEGTLIKAMPLFIGTDPRMSPSFVSNSSDGSSQRGFFDNTENYKQLIIGKLKPRMRDISFGELESIFDEEYRRMDTLVLTTCAVNLMENLGKDNINISLTMDLWQTKIAEGAQYWAPKLTNRDLDSEDIKNGILQWHREYLDRFEKRIETFNRKGGVKP